MIWKAPQFEAPYWGDQAAKSVPTHVTANEQDRAPVKTGLLDAEGRPLFREDPRKPIGFLYGKLK